MLRQTIEDFLRKQDGVDAAKLADPNIRMQDVGLDSLAQALFIHRQAQRRLGSHRPLLAAPLAESTSRAGACHLRA